MKEKNKKVLIIVLSILLVLVVLCSSILVIFLSANTNKQTLKWIKQTILKEYQPSLPDDFENYFDAFVAENGGSRGDYTAVYQAINTKLLDKYSRFYTKEEYKAQQKADSGQSAGVGLAFEAGTNTLARIPIGSPLYFANNKADKVEVGMSLTKIDDVTVQNFAEIQTQMYNYGINDSMHLTFTVPTQDSTIADGSAGKSITLDNVTVKPYTESYLLYSYNKKAYAYIYKNSFGVESGWTDVTEYTPTTKLISEANTAYIQLASFMGKADYEFYLAMQQYKQDGASKLLLDLRNNGGGYVNYMATIAQYFLKNGKNKNNVVMRAKFKDGHFEDTYAEDNYYASYLANSTIKVMANQNSASASEALLGVLISYGAIDYKDIYLTEISGEARTYGKGIMQSTFVHPIGGYALKLTTAQIYWPNSKTIHGVGVTRQDGASVRGAYSLFAYGDPELRAVLREM